MLRSEAASLFTADYALSLVIWRDLMALNVAKARTLKAERSRPRASDEPVDKWLYRMADAQTALEALKRRSTIMHLLRAIKQGKRHLAGEAEQKTALWQLCSDHEEVLAKIHINVMHKIPLPAPESPGSVAAELPR